MTRKERIDFIRKYNKKYTCCDFSEYDNQDLLKICFETERISKEAEVEFKKKINTPLIDWWGNILCKLPMDCKRWYNPKNSLTFIWLFFFNPFMWILWFFGIMLLLFAYFNGTL